MNGLYPASEGESAFEESVPDGVRLFWLSDDPPIT